VGGGAQTMYTHVSKCKNNKIKGEKNEKDYIKQEVNESVFTDSVRIEFTQKITLYFKGYIISEIISREG
jgi:hypothetical protein